MEILIVSGLSGSGKSKTASFLEDIGYYIIGNMSDFCTHCAPTLSSVS